MLSHFATTHTSSDCDDQSSYSNLENLISNNNTTNTTYAAPISENETKLDTYRDISSECNSIRYDTPHPNFEFQIKIYDNDKLPEPYMNELYNTKSHVVTRHLARSLYKNPSVQLSSSLVNKKSFPHSKHNHTPTQPSTPVPTVHTLSTTSLHQPEQVQHPQLDTSSLLS